MAADGLIAVQYPCEGGNFAIAKDAISAITSQRAVAVIEVPDSATAAALKGAQGIMGMAAYAFVASGASPPGAEPGEAAASPLQVSAAPSVHPASSCPPTHSNALTHSPAPRLLAHLLARSPAPRSHTTGHRQRCCRVRDLPRPRHRLRDHGADLDDPGGPHRARARHHPGALQATRGGRAVRNGQEGAAAAAV